MNTFNQSSSTYTYVIFRLSNGFAQLNIHEDEPASIRLILPEFYFAWFFDVCPPRVNVTPEESRRFIKGCHVDDGVSWVKSKWKMWASVKYLGRNRAGIDRTIILAFLLNLELEIYVS